MLIKEEEYLSKSKKDLINEINNLKSELLLQGEKTIYEDWFNNTAELIYIVTYEGILIDVNQAVLDKYGYSKEELIGQSGDILAAPGMNDLEKAGKDFEKVIKENIEVKYDWWSRKKNGEIFPKEFIMRQTVYGGQNVILLNGRDISERMHFEQKLIKSEKQYRSLFERNLAGIYRTKVDGEIVDCNPSFAHILGYDNKEELIGKINAIDLYVDKEYRLKNIQKLTKQQGIIGNRIELIRKDGSKIWALISTSAIHESKDPDKIDYLEGTIIDITDLIQAESLIHRSQESYRMLLDSSPFGVVLHDDGKIILTNKKAREMMGLDDEEKGKTFTVYNFLHEKDHDLAKVRIEQTYQGTDLPFQEYKLKRKDGKEISVETKTNLIDFNGKQVVLISFHDITRIKQLEKEKVRTQLVQEVNERLTKELEEKTRIQNKLIASEEMLKSSLVEKEVLLKEVHHRVKNNLQVISSIFNLQKNYSNNNTVRDILVESQNRIKSMAFIHESLYKTTDFASINFSEYAETLCQNLLKTYYSYSNTPELKLEIQEVFLNLDFAIPCGLILNELITNAIKYAFKGIEDGHIIVRINQEGKKVDLIIEDNGIGLPKDINFEDSSTLGFQLVNALVSQLNGTVSLKVDEGTKFFIQFTTK